MYDTVIIEDLKLLPELPKTITSYIKNSSVDLAPDFQTKDLENALLTFYIDKNGNLFEERRVPSGRRVKRTPLWEAWKDNRTFLERIYFKFIDKKYLTSPYKKFKTMPEFKTVKKRSTLTQTFNIYTFHDVKGRYLDLEYSVEVIKGKVKDVKLVKSNLESEKDSEKRRKQNAEFDKKMLATIEARRVFTSKWYYPILREVYNPIVFFGRKIVQYVCTKIINWTYRWRSI